MSKVGRLVSYLLVKAAEKLHTKTGCDYDKDICNLESRIFELKKEKEAADKELDQLNNVDIKTPCFDIHTFTYVYIKVKIESFEPPKQKKIRTMKDLMEKREKEEAERRKQLKLQVTKNYDTIKSFIHSEEPDAAEDLLFRTSSVIKELKDEQLNQLYLELQDGIRELREVLHQREIKRRKEDAKRRAEEEARRLKQELLRKQLEKEERDEKERLAREYEERLAREEEKRHLEISRLTSLVTRKKEDGVKIIEYLKIKGIKRFYHFTDKNNLNRIRKLGGLYSWFYCEQNDIDIPNAGGDSYSRSYDKQHGLEDYVRLSFCNDHPMAWRKHKEGSSLVLLYVDIEVASFKETLFTDRNAASSSFSCGGNLENLQKVNIPATQRNYVSRYEGETFSQHQAECMVKTFIPIGYITNIGNPQPIIF